MEYYDALGKGTAAGINRMRPGIITSEIYEVTMNAVKEAGIPHYNRHHVGHGIGIEVYDPPLVTPTADTIIEEDEVGRKLSYFRVNVETDKNYIEFQGEKLPIIPGMEVSVSILKRKKTILEYILKPLIKAKQKALTEIF